MNGWMVTREDGKVKVDGEWVTPTALICEDHALTMRKGAENYLADTLKTEPTARLIEVASAYAAALAITASSKAMAKMMAYGEEA